ncbi:hypothetical protein [Nocardia tengchongensis]|uniref:hypothetical protein n=1 Tax=Nocardia tengchongensis TaxID=2055889 RepID=UPI003648BD84
MNQAPIIVDRWALQRAIGSAVTEFMNGLAPDVPPLQWRLSIYLHDLELSGMAHTVHHADPAAVAAQWAALLGLGDEKTQGPYRIFRGQIPSLPAKDVEVWYGDEQAAAPAAGEGK